ncbi:V-type ATPase subunit [Chloroflexota bacterium]
MLDTKYEFISAYLKSGEAKVITHDHINRISRASSLQDVLTGLISTDIGSYLEEVPLTTFDEVDGHLWRYLGKCIAQLESFLFIPGDVLKILRAYIAKYDVHNVKAALYKITLGKEARMIPVGIIHDHWLLDELSRTENTDSLLEVLTRCNLEDYVSALKESKIEEGVKPNIAVESKLDGIYYKNLLDKAKKVKDGFVLIKAIGLIIDLTNLQIASRAIIEGIGMQAATSIITEGYLLPTEAVKELLTLKLTDVPDRIGIPLYRQVLQEVLDTYNRTHSVTSVEEIIDKRKFILVKELLSPRVLPPLVLVWYLILKELELRNLRLILKAMFDHIPLEEINEHLVLPS